MTLCYDPRELGLEVFAISGNEVTCLCPFHDDKHPSASFNVVSGLFVCYSCSTGANVHKLARKLGGTVKLISSVKVNAAIKTSIDMEWKHLLTFPLALDHPYLRARRVTNAQVKEFGILSSSKGIIIPVRSKSGDTKGVIVRRFDNSPRYMFYGEKLSLWPLDRIGEQKPLSKVIITEGIFGALRGRKYGIPVFASMGAMVKKDAATHLQNFYPKVLFDNDFAGMLGAARLLIMIPTTKVFVPGMEADELDKSEWQDVSKDGYSTRNLQTLAKLSKNVNEFYRSIKSFMRKVKGNDNDQRRWKREEETGIWP